MMGVVSVIIIIIVAATDAADALVIDLTINRINIFGCIVACLCVEFLPFGYAASAHLNMNLLKRVQMTHVSIVSQRHGICVP